MFDGKLSEGLCYKETDEINPTNPYASYKTVMEKKLLTLAGPIIICRTSLVGLSKNNRTQERNPHAQFLRIADSNYGTHRERY